MRIVKMVLWTSKGGIGGGNQLKKNFSGDYRGGCMHKQGYENERAPIIFKRIQHIFDRDV